MSNMASGRREFKGRELKTHRSDAMEEEEVTFTDANETLRHAVLFPSLVYTYCISRCNLRGGTHLRVR
jgi:hypothetical protein